MSSLGQWFTDGGPMMIVVSSLNACAGIFVLVALVLAFVAAFSGKLPKLARVLGVLAVFGSILPMCAGVLGEQVAQFQLSRAMEAVPPDQQIEIQAAGDAAAAAPRNYGCASTACCFLPAALALLVAPRRKSGWESALDETVG